MVKGVSNVWVPVKEMDRALRFYRDMLDLKVIMETPEWSELDANGLHIGLNGREPAGASKDGGAVITFQSSDIDAEYEELKSKGVSFTGGVSDFEWGRIAAFKDSEGNDLQLYAPPAK